VLDQERFIGRPIALGQIDRGISERFRHSIRGSKHSHVHCPALLQGTDSVTSWFEAGRYLPSLTRRQQLLRHHVRRELRATDAERTGFDGPDGRHRAKHHLGGSIEVHFEINVAALAVR
jgi:hypothetical protein